MSNLIKVYDPIKGWVKPSERTTRYRSPVQEPAREPIKSPLIIVKKPKPSIFKDQIVACAICKTGNLIIEGKPCGVCEAMKKVAA